MSVLTPGAQEVFRCSVMKHLVANPSERWVNTYEGQTISTGVSTAMLIDWGQKIVLFEKAMHGSGVAFERMTISTWAQEEGYLPTNFVSVDLAGVGALSISGDLLSLEHVLKVRRSVQTGRFGNVFFRGALGESDVASPAGVVRLGNPSALDTRLANAVSANLTPFLPMGAGPIEFVMHGVSSTGYTHTRNITAFAIGGVGLAKVSRRYFNRSA